MDYPPKKTRTKLIGNSKMGIKLSLIISFLLIVSLRPTLSKKISVMKIVKKVI